jgi:DNA-binding CsgD family transcriptional regulator
MAATSASFVGDDPGSLRLLARAVDAARSQGAVSDLVNMLAAYATVEAWTGHMRSATAHATEGLTLAAQTGQHTYLAVYEATLAWLSAIRGDRDECDRLAAKASRAGAEQEFTPATSLATWARGLSALAAGRPAEAHGRLAPLIGDSDIAHPTVAVSATGDIVEAAVVAEAPSVAREAIDSLERFVTNTRAPWAKAVAARCRGVMDSGDVDRHFRDALVHHAQATRPFEHARTRLSYGGWLRRHRRRMDAREQLRGALDIFERLGALPWEARARAELRASGEAIGGRDPAAVERLTPQELQVVQIVRTGATNKQIAARLYLSPRTIDYHLRKVFTKLGLSSRAELIALVGQHPEFDSTV